MTQILKKEVWGKCAYLPLELQEKIKNQDRLGFGEIGKIIKKAYPTHGSETDDKTFNITLSMNETCRRRSLATIKIKAANEDMARRIALNDARVGELENVEWDEEDEEDWDFDGYEIENAEEVEGEEEND